MKGCTSRGIVDLDGQITDQIPIIDDGGRLKADTTNDTVEGLLSDILKQLKIMNIHFAILTDNCIEEKEIE